MAIDYRRRDTISSSEPHKFAPSPVWFHGKCLGYNYHQCDRCLQGPDHKCHKETA